MRGAFSVLCLVQRKSCRNSDYNYNNSYANNPGMSSAKPSLSATAEDWQLLHVLQAGHVENLPLSPPYGVD